MRDEVEALPGGELGQRRHILSDPLLLPRAQSKGASKQVGQNYWKYRQRPVAGGGTARVQEQGVLEDCLLNFGHAVMLSKTMNP